MDMAGNHFLRIIKNLHIKIAYDVQNVGSGIHIMWCNLKYYIPKMHDLPVS